MTRFEFARRFIGDLRSIEPEMSRSDRDLLESMLAFVAGSPESPRRICAYYDPDRPSWLVRGGPFLIHYAYDYDRDVVTFLNVFRRL